MSALHRFMPEDTMELFEPPAPGRKTEREAIGVFPGLRPAV